MMNSETLETLFESPSEYLDSQKHGPVRQVTFEPRSVVIPPEQYGLALRGQIIRDIKRSGTTNAFLVSVLRKYARSPQGITQRQVDQCLALFKKLRIES